MGYETPISAHKLANYWMYTASVVIPTKDRPIGLQAAVKSALSACALAGNCQVIIVYDGCGELTLNNTLDVTSEANCRVVMNSREPGPSGARNCGVECADSQLIFFLDDDDTMELDYISRVLRAISHRGSNNAVFGFSATKFGQRLDGPTLPAGVFPETTKLGIRLFALSAGVWIDREVYRGIGGLDETLRINEDTDLCLTLAALGHHPHYEPVPGVIRNTVSSMTTPSEATSLTRRTTSAARALTFERILVKHRRFLDGHPEERHQFAARVAKYMARDGRYLGALKFALSQPSGKIRALGQVVNGAISHRR